MFSFKIFAVVAAIAGMVAAESHTVTVRDFDHTPSSPSAYFIAHTYNVIYPR